MPYDASKFENETAFDPAEFIIPANDGKGQSSMVQFRSAHQYQRAMQQVIASQKFPYATVSDLVRHAMVRHLDWLTEIVDLPQTRQLVAMMHVVNRRLLHNKMDREVHDYIDEFREDIRSLIETGPEGVSEARKRVAQTLADIQRADAGFYRDRFLARIQSEFGYLLEPGDKSKVGATRARSNKRVSADEETVDQSGGDFES